MALSSQSTENTLSDSLKTGKTTLVHNQQMVTRKRSSQGFADEKDEVIPTITEEVHENHADNLELEVVPEVLPEIVATEMPILIFEEPKEVIQEQPQLAPKKPTTKPSRRRNIPRFSRIVK